MKGDFTRFTFDPAKHYSQVLKQQGRPDLDADWNEQGKISNNLIAESNRDTIGQTGFPKGNSFLTIPSGDATDLVIQPGHAYVDGILAQMDGTRSISYRNQPDFEPLPALTPVVDQTDLVYLDVWERHLTALEDDQMREPALGGVDTTTRLRTIAQVRIQPDVNTTVCATALDQIPARPGGGRLTTSTVSGNTAPNSCLLPPTGGYRGLENRLYRVEVHQGGAMGDATFKWSRDNGAVVFPIASFLAPDLVQLSRLGRDQLLTIRKNDWVEVLGDQTELRGDSGTLAQVLDVDPQARQLTLSVPVNAHSAESHPKVRRWDMASGAVGMNGGAAIALEDGIQVEFSLPNVLRPFRPGDYWLFTARAGSAGLESLTDAPARGVVHHYAALTLITWKRTGEVFTPDVHDCRTQFPALTAITASDVSFNNSTCGFPDNVATVQDAIDALCRKGCCTLTVEPGPGWEQVFNQLPEEGGIICLRPGEFRLATTLTVSKKGPMVIVGAGEASKILVKSAECAIRFVDCGTTVIRDLAARAQSTGLGSKGQGPNNGIRGVFDFDNCWNVVLENVVLTCASGAERAAACLSIHGSETRNWEVRVRSCRLKVGTHQNGIVVLNPARVYIASNTIEGTSTLVEDLPELLRNPMSLSQLRIPLISKVFVKQPPTEGIEPNVNFPTEKTAFIRFKTTPSLATAWMTLLNTATFNDKQDARDIQERLYRRVDRILRNDDEPAFSSVVKSIRGSMVGSAQAIVGGGTRAGEVRIDNNVITNFSQGVHIGLSKSGPRTKANVHRAGRVRVSSNSITLWIGPGLVRERHGIFVGNADSIVVNDNTLDLGRSGLSTDVKVDGIRLFGYFGRHIAVRDNYVANFDVGVRITARGPEYTPDTRFWRVTANAVLPPNPDATIAPLAEVS